MLTSIFALIAGNAAFQEPPPPIMTVPMPPPVPPAIYIPVPPPPPPPPPPSASPPTPARRISGSIGSDDYPAAAIRVFAEGTTEADVRVGADGRPSGCSTAISSGNDALDTATCTLIMRRFRYRPATRDGRPAEGIVRSSIVWTLPPRELLRFAPGELVWRAASAEGAAPTCTLNRSGDAFADVSPLCDSADPLIDPTGGPDTGHVRVTNVVRLLPEGARLAPLPAGRNPAYAVTAAIEVNPRGRIIRCTVGEERGAIPDYVRPFFTDMCAEILTEKAAGFAVHPPDPNPLRRATLQQLVYVEAGGQ